MPFRTHRRTYDALRESLEPRGVYLWLEESGVSPPSAWRAAGKAVGAIVGLAVVVWLVYMLGLAYLRKSGGIPPAARAENLLSSVLPQAVFNIAGRFGGGGAGGGGGAQASSDVAFARFSNESGQLEMRNAGKRESEEEEEEDPRVEVLDPSTMTMRSLEAGAEAGVHRSFANPMFDLGKRTGAVPKKEEEEEADDEGASPGLIKLVSIVEAPKEEDKKVEEERKVVEDKVQEVLPTEVGFGQPPPIVDEPPPQPQVGKEEEAEEEEEEESKAGNSDMLISI